MDRTDGVFAVALVGAGVVVPGILNYLLHDAGYPLYGTVTWVLGMAILVGGAWVLWLRDVELTGPID